MFNGVGYGEKKGMEEGQVYLIEVFVGGTERMSASPYVNVAIISIDEAKGSCFSDASLQHKT